MRSNIKSHSCWFLNIACGYLLKVIFIRVSLVDVGLQQTVNHSAKFLILTEFVHYIFDHLSHTRLHYALHGLLPKLFAYQREEANGDLERVRVMVLVVLEHIYENCLWMMLYNHGQVLAFMIFTYVIDANKCFCPDRKVNLL
jgi:hypothetical protein